jgi:tetratricopeptide (TPR) repeat protein
MGAMMHGNRSVRHKRPHIARARLAGPEPRLAAWVSEGVSKLWTARWREVRSLMVAPPLLMMTVVLFFACKPTTPPPKTAPQPAASTPTAEAAPPEPERDLSQEGKTSFAEAVKELEAAQKAGLKADRCEALADRFGDIYGDYPKIIEAKFNEGAMYQRCGQRQKAEQVYKELLRKEPGYGPALNNLGQLALERGEVAVAEGFFRKAAEAKDSAGYANIALLQRERALRTGDRSVLKQALNNIHRALAVDSFNVGAYEAKATLVFDHAKSKSQLEIARLICVQAIDRFPEYAPVHNLLGLVLLRMDEVTRALRAFRQAVALDPDFIEAQMNIGAITLSFRDYKAAEASFSKVLSLDPAAQVKFEATVGLGVAYRGQRRFDEAMARYREAKQLDPSKASVDYNMGILLQDYMFDPSSAAQAVSTLEQARTLLQRFVASGSQLPDKVADARRRLKNIAEMLPLLREQQNQQG